MDSDLQALIALEQSNLPHQLEDNVGSANKIISCDLIAKSSSNLHKEVREKTFGQVEKWLVQLEDTFALIFRALQVLSCLQAPNSPLERDKISKRSREFQTRLKRNAFEAKQQVRETKNSGNQNLIDIILIMPINSNTYSRRPKSAC